MSGKKQRRLWLVPESKRPCRPLCKYVWWCQAVRTRCCCSDVQPTCRRVVSLGAPRSGGMSREARFAHHVLPRDAGLDGQAEDVGGFSLVITGGVYLPDGIHPSSIHPRLQYIHTFAHAG